MSTLNLKAAFTLLNRAKETTQRTTNNFALFTTDTISRNDGGGLGLTLTVPAAGITDNAFCVDWDNVKKLSKVTGFSTMTATYDAGKVTFYLGKKVFTFPAFPGDAFTTAEKTGEYLLKCELDASTITTAARFMSKDELRPAMCGIFFDDDGLCSTDAHRMYVPAVVMSDAPDFILPAKAVRFFSKNDGKTTFKVSSDGRRFTATTAAGVTVQGDVVGARYPDYKSIMPRGGETVTFDRALLIDAFESALIVANDYSKTVKFYVSEISAEVASADLDQGTTFSQVIKPLESYVYGLKIAFNGALLVDTLKLFPGGEVTFKVTTGTAAAVVGNDVIIMPVAP